jgi:hypothetical protein
LCCLLPVKCGEALSGLPDLETKEEREGRERERERERERKIA